MVDKNLQEELAIRRTKLAEERTQLSYIRTGMNLTLAGLFFMGYFPPDSVYAYVGILAIVIGVFFLAYGFHTHRKSREWVERVLAEPFPSKRNRA